MSLCLQLYLTFLFNLLTSAQDNANITVDNIDEMCARMKIKIGNDNSNEMTLEKHSNLFYNRSLWSYDDGKFMLSYDGWTNCWELSIPSASSNQPTVYRIESKKIVPPSTTQWTNKWTQKQSKIEFFCQSSLPSIDDLVYPHTLQSCAQISEYFNFMIPSGIYKVTLSNKLIDVFCKFDAENEFAWTLVESFRKKFAPSLYSLSFTLSLNAKKPNERNSVYRLPLKQMNAIQSVSTHNLVTCNFDISRSAEHILLNTQQNGWNILTKTNSICRSIESMNIRGYQCKNGTAPFWTLSNHFHVDSSYKNDECSCNEWTDDAVKNEDNFGQFSYENPSHSCSESNISTTNFWIGSHVNMPTMSPSISPTPFPTFPPTEPCEICNCSQNINQTVEPTPTPCPTLNPLTLSPTNRIIVDCDVCTRECNDYTFAPTVFPTISPTVDAKISTNYSVIIELMIEYDTFFDLCPSHNFDKYLLELSICQVLDIESTFCEILDIASISMIESAANYRRFLQDLSIGFDIFVLIQISAEDEMSLNVINRLLNQADFAQNIDEKWKQNDGKQSGNIVSLQVEDEHKMNSLSPTHFPTMYPTEIQINETQIPFIELPVVEGMLNFEESIGIVVVIAFLLCFIVGTICFFINRQTKKYYANDAISRYVDETKTISSNKDVFRHSNMHKSRGYDQINEEEQEQEHTEEEEEDEISRLEQDNNDNQQHVIEILNDEQNANTKSEEEFNAVLSMNGFAEFDDDELRASQVIFDDNALPMDRTGTNDGYSTNRDRGNNYRQFFMQKGPVISQIQIKKYQDLMAEKKFLDILENRLNEIEQCQEENAQNHNNNNNNQNDSNNEPGAMNISFRVSSDTINQLHTELNTLSLGIKNILNRIGYPIDDDHNDHHDQNDDDMDNSDKITTKCIEHCVYLNHVIAKHHNDLAKHLMGDNEDEMDLIQLQEKSRKLAEQSKRSSSKVAKSYLNLQTSIEQNKVKNIAKQKSAPDTFIHTRSRNSSAGNGNHHRRGKSHEFLSDDTSTVSGMSDVERKLNATNDKDVMRNFGLCSMEYISEKHKKISAEIMETMPDSPSMSNLSSLQTPVNETLILSSENNLDFTKFKNNKNKPPLSYIQKTAKHQSGNGKAGTRDSREHIEYNEEEEYKDIADEETVKYSDPSPLHPFKKYDGYVGKAIHRMDSDGVLPTPSISESKNYSFGVIEKQKSSDEQYKYAVTKLSQLKSDNSNSRKINLNQSNIPNPPSNTLNNVSRAGADDLTENDEDDDLKQFEMDIVIETDGVNNDNDNEQNRNRGISNSMSSQSQSQSGANSLNSNDSVDPIPQILEKKTSKTKIKKKEKTKNKKYDPKMPINSISSSHAETDIDIKKEDEMTKKVNKKKKKKKKINKAPKNPKIKSPFFESDAAVTKTKDSKNAMSKKKSKKNVVPKLEGAKSKKGKNGKVKKKKSKSKLDK